MNKLTEFILIRNIKKNTERLYRESIKIYENCIGMTLDELIEEAEQEEIQRIRLKDRKIREYLLRYRIFLEKKYSYNTQKNYFTHIKTVYRTFGIEIPYIPTKKTQPTPSTTFEELLTKKELQFIINNVSIKFKALILFMISSGCAIAEATSITIEDFINATKEYTNATTLKEVISSLEKQDDIVPTFFVTRMKTNKEYYTFCTPEATRAILSSLKERIRWQKVYLDDPLFGWKKETARANFKRFCNKFNIPKKRNGTFKFHSHGLRKYFCVMLEKTGMNKMDIDFLCGRTPDVLTDAYFPISPERRIVKYKKCMYAVSLMDDVNYVEISSKEKKEYDEIKQELLKQKEDNIEIKRMLHELNKIL